MIKKYYIKWEKDVLVVICNLGKYVHSVENILVLDVEKVEVERNKQPTIYATIAENLPKYIKAARDLSLLGGYQKSLETYKKIFQIIEIRMNEISNDNYLIEKWKETNSQQYMQLLQKISSPLEKF